MSSSSEPTPTRSVVLVLDPATSTGYALAEVTYEREMHEIGARAHIYEYGCIDVDLSADNSGDHCIDLMKKVKRLIVKHQVTHVGVEDYFFNKRTANGSNVNAAFRTAIHILCRLNKLPYWIINISSWKRYATGDRIRPTKEQVKKWGKEPAKKLMIQQALWERFKIKFPNHVISTKTGKPIGFRSDVVDAVAQMVYLLKIVFLVPTSITIVEPTPDVVMKTGRRSVYQYPVI